MSVSWWPAHRVAAAIAARELSAREYLDAQLARIERHDTGVSLVATLDERAWKMAEKADEAVVRGAPLGPLHGVAMTVKDCWATRGLRTTGGLELLRDYLPREDAVAVARLRAAGAIVFGKSNVPAGAGDLQAYNALFGVSRNPWNPDFSTSGSSGGAAGAVAAGFTPVELGSDIAGSIRLPAAACGVFGHKPSYGVVSLHGHVPPYPWKHTVADLAVGGPIARCAEDLEVLLTAMAGPHPWDERAWRVSLPAARPVTRVATWFDDPYCQVDDEIRDALEQAAALLGETGVTVEHARPLGISLRKSDEIFRRLLAAAAVANYTEDAVEAIAAGGLTTDGELGGEFAAQRFWHWSRANEERARLRTRWRQFFTHYDAILLPVTANQVIKHDHRPLGERTVVVNGRHRPYWDQLVWPGLTSVSYLPSTVVPLRLDSHGLPVGIAIATDYLDDLTALALARRLTEIVPPLGVPASVAT
ncbi:amidase family protein [Nonomuraea insulae]|uniref:Amidase family protein n=1 Tax=Nonomuraea insulae TaxID=1616787 RepID=A0ABW1D6C2_9ACTN